MKEKVIRGASALIKILAAVTAATAYLNPQMLPAKYVIPALLLGFCVSTLKDFLITFCDILDDGKRNGSFDVSKLGLIALLCCSVALVSCGMTREQWAVIGKGVLLREAPIVYGEVVKAREATSGKQLVAPVNP